MSKENISYVHSGSVLTKEQTDMIYKLAEKPIKIIFEDVTEVNMNGYDIEIKGRLSGIEAERIIGSFFGTTDIGALDCSHMTEEEINEIVEKKMIPMYLGNCEELDCEYFQWCGDSYGDRNTECYCLLNRARVYRDEAEEKHIECPLGKMWDEDDT